MTREEACKTIGVKHVPWYRDPLFWAITVGFGANLGATLMMLF